jgi:serine/threonine protein phosphatase PrpC
VLTVITLGDSRRVLPKKGWAVRLTVDHKPDVPEEAQRIQAKGGSIKNGRVVGMFPVSGAQRPDVT